LQEFDGQCVRHTFNPSRCDRYIFPKAINPGPNTGPIIGGKEWGEGP